MKELLSKVFSRPIFRFALVGGTTVLIDAIVYTVAVLLGANHDVGKAIGFVSGAIFAYFANWRFTFGSRKSRWSELLFIVVYATALAINVTVNSLVLSVMSHSAIGTILAFLVATAISAVWNFVGMSLLVFRSKPGGADG